MSFTVRNVMTKVGVTVIGFILSWFSVPVLAGGPGPNPPTVATAEASKPKPVKTPMTPGCREASAAYDAGDYDKAKSLWLPLAQNGETCAQRGMGKLYSKGRGVERDFAKAFEWYRPAAEKGDAESQYRLSVGYGYGLGVEKNEAKAMMWLRKAAENGQKRAQKSLAEGYQDGLHGLPRDPEQAKYWYDRSKTRE